jgi:hypothetical protein
MAAEIEANAGTFADFTDRARAAGALVVPAMAFFGGLGDVLAADTPTPTAVDEHRRSAQTFLVDVVVRSGGAKRRAAASGQDIYAVTAPLVVEAVHRILMGQTRTVGVASAGEIFDAPDFLRALSSHISLQLRP